MDRKPKGYRCTLTNGMGQGAFGENTTKGGAKRIALEYWRRSFGDEKPRNESWEEIRGFGMGRELI